MTTTVQATLANAVERLRQSSPTPRLDAELLLAHILHWSRPRLLAERQQILDVEQQEEFIRLVERRVALEPVAYITGHKEFYGLDFLVDRRVLVPRPETELLVELALERAVVVRRAAHSPIELADVGTGSGCIAVVLARLLPEALVQAVDFSADALALAAANVARHGVAGQVLLVQGDLLEPITGPLDMIVSNPPYTVLNEVDPGVRLHEPHLALDGGAGGLEIYGRLLEQAAAKLRASGVLLLEIGAWQGAALLALAQSVFPHGRWRLHQDLAGRDRVLEVWPAG